MGTAFKVIVAFCIGLGGLYAAQRLWLGYVMAEIAAQPDHRGQGAEKHQEPVQALEEAREREEAWMEHLDAVLVLLDPLGPGDGRPRGPPSPG